MSPERRARLRLETACHLLQAASPEALPLLGLAAVWLFNLAEDGYTAGHCVDGCITLHYALAEYGIESRVEAIAVRIERGGSGALYSSPHGPMSDADGNFDGHTVLVVPEAGRFVDPTLQQFPEIPNTERDLVPVVARMPSRDGMGDQALRVYRGDYIVAYLPLPEAMRQAWRNPVNTSRDADYREAAANLAAMVFAMMRDEDVQAKPEQ